MVNELDKKKKEIFDKYEFIEPFDCTTMDQLEVLESILQDPKVGMPDFTPRDVKHYNDDEKAYEKKLLEAWEICNKYGDPPIVITELFAELRWLGIAKPMSKKEAREVFVRGLAYDKLRAVAVSERIAKKLTNQIADYKEKYNLIRKDKKKKNRLFKKT